MSKLTNNFDLLKISTTNPKVSFIKLRLPSGEKKVLCKLNEEKKSIFIIKNKLFNSTNSIGINYDLLFHQKLNYNIIFVSYLKNEYQVSRKYWQEHGKIKQFGANSDVQSFLPLKEFHAEVINTPTRSKLKL